MRAHLEKSEYDSRETNWSLKILKQELEGLKREQIHLKAKSQERALTGWETLRLEEILDEAVALLGEFSKIRFSAPSR